MIFFILIAGFVLRIISLNQSLWLDEAINVLAVRDNPFVYTISQYPRYDFHPPGYFAILWVWTHLFGYSEVAVRLPSVIFGLLTVWLVYLIARKLISETFGLWSSVLCAVNPLLVYYSQEARPYVFAAFSVCLSFYYFLKLLKDEQNSLLGYTLSLLLLFTSDYLAYFVIPAQGLYIVLERSSKLTKQFLKSLISPMLLLMIWSPYFFSQLGNGLATARELSTWRIVVGKTGVYPLILTYVKFIIGRISLINKGMYLAIFLIPGMLFGYLLLKGSKNEAQLLFGPTRAGSVNKLLLLWLIFPVLTTWTISFIVPIFDYFRVLFAVPAFLLIIVLGIDQIKSRYKNLVLVLVVFFEVMFTSVYLTNPQFWREDWRSLASFLDKVDDGLVVLESSGNFAPLRYYANKDLPITGGLINIPTQNLRDVKGDFGEAKNVYLVNYLVDITDPNRLLRQKLLQLNYKLENTYNFNGVGFVYLYSKL